MTVLNAATKSDIHEIRAAMMHWLIQAFRSDVVAVKKVEE